MKNDIIHPQLSYKLTGLCFQIHNELGRFCKEKQYADKLEDILKQENLYYAREVELNPTDAPGNKADFVIENSIIIDLKAKKFITKGDYYQMQRYLSAANLKLGMIVNFRNTYLKPKRVLRNHSRHSPDSHVPIRKAIRIPSFASPSNHSDRSEGFTLLELVVAAGIFTVLITISMGFYGRFVASQRRDIAEQKLLEEIRLTLEIFDREARTAYASTYALTDSTGESIIFRNQNGDCVQYSLDSNRHLKRGEGSGGTSCEPSDIVPASITPLTSRQITFNTLKFLPAQAAATDSGNLTSQGYITVVIEAAVNNPTVPPLKIQSTVTSRQVISYPQ